MKINQFSVLVADDELSVVASLIEQIEHMASKFKHPVRIIAASSAVDVLSQLTRTDVDVLFLDYHFEGGMNGDEIIDNVSDPFGQKLIILMSARSQAELENLVVKRHMKLGMRFKFLRKPFDNLQLQETYLSIQEFLSNRPYPYPLAYPHEVIKACRTSQGKLTAIKDLAEAIVIYSAAVFTADSNRLKLLDCLHVGLGSNAPLTFGAWLRWMSAARESLTRNTADSFMPELLDFYSDPVRDCAARNLLYSFKNEVRDAELGHGAVHEEEWYQSLVDRYGVRLQDLFERLYFTAKYPLFSVESVDFPIESSLFKYSIRSLAGAGGVFPLLSIETDVRLTRGDLYLCNPRGEFLPLWPVVIFVMCVQCTFRRVFCLQSVCAAKFTYRSSCNHVVAFESADLKHDQWCTKLPKLLFSVRSA